MNALLGAPAETAQLITEDFSGGLLPHGTVEITGVPEVCSRTLVQMQSRYPLFFSFSFCSGHHSPTNRADCPVWLQLQDYRRCVDTHFVMRQVLTLITAQPELPSAGLIYFERPTCRLQAQGLGRSRWRVGYVPTMGYLHPGLPLHSGSTHISLKPHTHGYGVPYSRSSGADSPGPE